MEAKIVSIYIDGAARGNPGVAGIGVLITDGKKRKLSSLHKFIGVATNNSAEYTACIYALQQALILGLKEIVLYSDSELLVKQLNGEYRVKNENLLSLYEQIQHLKTGFTRLEIKQIAREENKEADKLANKAIDSQVLF